VLKELPNLLFNAYKGLRGREDNVGEIRRQQTADAAFRSIYE
jgi:hypothetical protein